LLAASVAADNCNFIKENPHLTVTLRKAKREPAMAPAFGLIDIGRRKAYAAGSIKMRIMHIYTTFPTAALLPARLPPQSTNGRATTAAGNSKFIGLTLAPIS
jgi:hypothetical protein